MSVQAQDILMRFTAQDKASPVYQQVVKAAQDVERQTGKANAELVRLGESTIAVVKTLDAHAKALDNNARSTRQASDNWEKGGKIAADFAKGLLSTLGGLSLLAGGAVAAGHALAGFLDDALQRSQKLHESIADISALNPTLDTSNLLEQLTDLEGRVGVLGDKLADIYKRAAGPAKGDAEDTLILTGELASGARGARQDPSAWATAAVQTMQAYNLTIADTARIQNVLTVSMQDSYGQGDKMLGLWGSVNKAAANAGTSLEANAAAMVVLAQGGGDLEENLRALKGLYDALSTEQARNQLHELGVVTEGAGGQLLGLDVILKQLNTRIGEMDPAKQKEFISGLFQDRDVRNAAQTLLGSYEDLAEQQQKNIALTDASAKAQEDYYTSEQGHIDRVNAGIDAYLTKLGELIDLRRHAAGLTSILEDDTKNRQMVEVQRVGPAQYLQNHSPDEVKGFRDAFKELDDILTKYERDQARANGTLDALGGIVGGVISGVSGLTSGVLSVTGALEEEYRAVHQVSSEYETFVTWHGQVLDSSNSLIPTLEGVSSEFNQIYQEAARLTQGGQFGGFASAAEQDLANVAQALKDSSRELATWQAIAAEPMPLEGFFGVLASGGLAHQINSLRERIRELMEDAKRIADEVKANSPEAKQATDNFNKFAQQERYAASMTRAQDALNASTERYNNTIQALQDQQYKLQTALRDDSTPELAAARQQLDDATANLKDGTDRYDASIQKLNDDLKDTRDAGDKALEPLIADLKDAKDALDTWSSGASDVMDILNDQLYDLQEAERRTRAESEGILAPFIAEAKEAADTLQTLEDEMSAQDAMYGRARANVEELVDELDELEHATLDPLRDEIQGLQDDLYDLQAAEEAAVRPFEDMLYGQAQALQDAQDAVKALADEYADRLNPLQKELNALQKEAQAQENADKLHEEALSVENLAARLASAKKGTSEYLEIQRQLARAQNQQARDTRIIQLQDQIGGIEEERDEALAAANERVEAAQREYDATRESIEQIKRKYELEARAIEDSLRSKQREYDQEKRTFDQRREQYRKDIDDIDDEQRAYDRAQQAKIENAKSVVAWTQAALENEQANRKLIDDTAAAAVESQQGLIRSTQHIQEVTSRSLKDAVEVAQGAYDDVKGFYDGLVTAAQGKIDKEKEDALAFEQSAKDQVDDAALYYKDLRQQYTDNINRIGDQIRATQATAGHAQDAAKKVIEAERRKQLAYLTTLKYLNMINETNKNGGVADPSKLPPVSEYGDDQELPPGYTDPPPPGGKSGKSGKAPVGGGGGGGGGGTPPETPIDPRAKSAVPDLPVPGGTIAGMSVGSINLQVALNVGGSTLAGDPTKESTYYPVAEAMFGSVQTVLSQKYGVKIAVVPS